MSSDQKSLNNQNSPENLRENLENVISPLQKISPFNSNDNADASQPIPLKLSDQGISPGLESIIEDEADEYNSPLNKKKDKGNLKYISENIPKLTPSVKEIIPSSNENNPNLEEEKEDMILWPE